MRRTITTRTAQSATARRGCRSRLVPALGSVTCVLGLALGTGPLPASAAAADLPLPSAVGTTAQLVSSTVTLSVDALAPEVLTTGQDLQVTGSLTNGTQAPLSSTDLEIQVQSRTEMSATDLASWLTGGRETSLSVVHLEGLEGQVAPGETRSFSVTVPWDSLPLDDGSQWGPRGLEVSVLDDGGSPLAQDRSLLVWDGGVTVAPSRVTTIIPVTASPSEVTLLSQGADEQPADEPPGDAATASATPSSPAADPSTAPTEDPTAVDDELHDVRERVLGLLSLSGEGVVLAVDPALLEVLGVSVPVAPTTEASATPQPTSSPSPSAPPSSAPTAAAHGSELSAALTRAAQSGDVIALPWADADVSALAHLGESDLLSSALTRTAASGSVSLGASVGVVWPAGALDTTTLDALGGEVTTVIAQPADLPVTEDLTYTPSGTTVAGGRRVLVPDADLSAALSGQALAEDGSESLSELDARQLLRADSAVLTRQAPSAGRDVVVTMSREEASTEDPAVIAQRVAALSGTSWTSSEGLDSLLASADHDILEGDLADRQDLPTTSAQDQEVSAAELSQARDAATYLSSVSTVLTDPQEAFGRAGDVVATTASASWRSAPQARATAIATARQQGQDVAHGLSAAPSSTINLISASADLPVRIVSTLDQDVTLNVRLAPSSRRLQVGHPLTVTVPADSQATVKVPVSAVGSGDVDLTIELLAKDGTVVGTPTTVHMRVRADWESLGTRVAGAGLVIMLVVGITRTVRRGRRTDTGQEKA